MIVRLPAQQASMTLPAGYDRNVAIRPPFTACLPTQNQSVVRRPNSVRSEKGEFYDANSVGNTYPLSGLHTFFRIAGLDCTPLSHGRA